MNKTIKGNKPSHFDDKIGSDKPFIFEEKWANIDVGENFDGLGLFELIFLECNYLFGLLMK